MKILLSGLQPDFDRLALRERMARFGPVIDRFIRARVMLHA